MEEIKNLLKTQNTNEAFIIHTLGVLGGKIEILVTLREDIKKAIEDAIEPIKTTLKDHAASISGLEQSKQRAYGAMAVGSAVLTLLGGLIYFVMQKVFGH